MVEDAYQRNIRELIVVRPKLPNLREPDGGKRVLVFHGLDLPLPVLATMHFVELQFIARLTLGRRSELPPFLGPTLRGAFGHLLKKAVCQIRNTPCPNCLLRQVCPYPNLFEGLPPIGKPNPRSLTLAPQPFVLEFAGDGATRDGLSWKVRLFGPAGSNWAYVVHVFRSAGEEGIGRNRVQFSIDGVLDGATGRNLLEGADLSPEPCNLTNGPISRGCTNTLRIWMLSPTKLVRQGKLISRRLSPLDIIAAARRRLELLNHFYGERPLGEDRRFAADEFRVVDENLRRFGFRRFSTRQQTSMEMAGLLGEIAIAGPWHEAGAWLDAMPIVHLGKATSFGFGQVRWSFE